LGFQVKSIQEAQLHLYGKTIYLTITTFKEGGFLWLNTQLKNNMGINP